MVAFEVVESIEIAAPPELVWAYRLDYTTLPDYNPLVRPLERVDKGDAPGVGASYRFQVDMGAGPIDAMLTVLEAVPYSRIVNDAAGEGGAAREVVTVVPANGGSRLQLAVTNQLPDDLDTGARDAIISASRAHVQLELENIKAALEARV
jgi:uncharacterized protein YndB with AHSA1/START domain